MTHIIIIKYSIHIFLTFFTHSYIFLSTVICIYLYLYTQERRERILTIDEVDARQQKIDSVFLKDKTIVDEVGLYHSFKPHANKITRHNANMLCHFA